MIAPELDRCTLNVGGRALKSVGISPPEIADHLVGRLRIRLKGASISASGLGAQKPQWKAIAPGATNLVWLAADARFTYLAAYRKARDSEYEIPDTPLRVRRLETTSGKWLDDLPVNEKAAPGQTEAIQAALANGAHVLVLTVTTKGDAGWAGAGQLVSYQVSCFKPGETRCLWSKTFPSVGELARPGAVLLGSWRSPERTQPDVQPLTTLGEDVLVCAGPVQDLLCLEGNTGKERWRVERVWEFERGFIGPSVWQHYISRFGARKFDTRAKEQKPSPARQYAIVGGPIVVSPAKGGVDDDRRIFVAVARGPASYGEYLADCVVYELAADGRFLAMTSLPRMVEGGWFRIQPDGVVWACQNGAFVKLGVSRHDVFEMGMGPGGSDRLCRVDWYRQLSAEEPDAWLQADPSGDPVAFGDSLAFRVCEGGYVTRPNAGVYHFPLSMVDLKTGADQTIVLSVPFQGKLPPPKTNYTHTSTPHGEDRWQTRGPYVLAITRLQVVDNRLRVTLGMENWARSVEFDLDELHAQHSPSR